MTKSSMGFLALLLVTAVAFLYAILFIFMSTPTAQAAAGGIAQKIFYFHVPAAYAMYLAGAGCLLSSGAYLVTPSDRRNALAQATAECAVLFGSLVIVSGPLWAKKAWGVYWTWDPRLTTLLLSVLIYLAIVVVRSFAGDGHAERKFAAALGVLGTANLPIIHYAVKLWGGQHPSVIQKSGGGLGDPAMYQALYAGFGAFTLLAIVLIWMRGEQLHSTAQLGRMREEALATGILDD